MTVTRFAPSPTGLLHLGHAYAAGVAKHCARRESGEFLLRFEDIDHTRVRDDYYESGRQDLEWLGLGCDRETPRQLDRSARHAEALDALRELGVIYPCFCTRREVEAELAGMAAAPQGPEGPLYPGTCRRLSEAERNERLEAEAQPAWRLDAVAAAARVGPLDFSDRVHGKIQVDPQLLGDVVLGRKDIGTSYHVAVVIDDADDAITLVTRGEDLLPSTHVHRVLQALLDLPQPEYLHHILVTDESGRRLAKRDDARSIRHYRESGLSPAEVLALLPPYPSQR
ncbi:tRNA glutamyl-Q(34) synthetase GluQRS [Haloferula helveola]|uniref:tRNA glutamyl-Q(34) synthetase GluQRS n=1 Tax=Haloferula helveola TaxID=490095 RepID=A0ABN6H6X2_9BACT|nr:tRNA glutamyl-Q(34) synthetase GluQRS [Haloferula helveola]